MPLSTCFRFHFTPVAAHYCQQPGTCLRLAGCVWLSAVVAFLILLIVFVLDRMAYYRTWPVSTSFTLKQERPIQFPAVTVCSNVFAFDSRIALVNFTDVIEHPTDASLSELGAQPDELVIMCVFGGRKCSGLHAEEWLHPTFGLCLTLNGGQRPFRVGNTVYDASSLPSAFSSVGEYLSSREERVNYPPLGASEIAELSTTTKALSAKAPRADDGLTLYLGVWQNEYTAVASTADDIGIGWSNEPVTGVFNAESAGVRIAVHDRFKTPDMDTATMLHPGKETHVTYRKRVVTSQPPSWGDCSPRFWNETGGRPLPSGNYSVASCELVCAAKLVEAECGCLTVPTPRGFVPAHSGTRTCSLTMECPVVQQEKVLLGQVSCPDCVKDCSATEFPLTTSILSWPAAPSQQVFLDLFDGFAQLGIGANALANISTAQDGLERLQSNVLLARIYPSSSTYEEVTSNRAYSITSLLSDLGGQAGLWGGISILTAIEFVEVIGVGFMACFGISCARNAFTDPDEEQEVAPDDQATTHTSPIGSAHALQSKTASVGA